MRTLDLGAAVASARQDGWCTLSGTIDDVRAAGRRLGWTEVPLRKGDPPKSTLVPAALEHAHPNSLSSLYGLGAQPLHTDGAHLIRPPDVVVLCAQEANETATRLRRVWTTAGHLRRWPAHIHDGVFVVRSGRDSFYATARLRLGVRFDPGCMTPCDQRARKLTSSFADALEDAEEYRWTTPGQVLVIENATTLHARAEVSDTDIDRELDRVAFDTRSPR